jgi:hypothetical protein
MENEFMKRGYLLPDGCKDMIQTLKLPLGTQNECNTQAWFRKILEAIPQEVPIKGALEIPKKIFMGKLAAMLDKEPYPIICRMMLLGIFPHERLDFETAAVIAKKYGFIAKQADE